MSHRRDPPTGLDVDLLYDEWVAVVRVIGEVDIATVETLRRVVDDAAGSGHDLLIDLTPCTFIDSTAISELVRARRLALARDASFAIAHTPAGEPARLLELVGGDTFDTYDSLEAAVSALRPSTGTSSVAE